VVYVIPLPFMESQPPEDPSPCFFAAFTAAGPEELDDSFAEPVQS